MKEYLLDIEMLQTREGANKNNNWILWMRKCSQEYHELKKASENAGGGKRKAKESSEITGGGKRKTKDTSEHIIEDRQATTQN